MSVTVRVVMELKLDNLGTWGDDCTAGQIKKQALEEATKRLSKLLEVSHGAVKMITDPKVVTLVYKDDDYK